MAGHGGKRVNPRLAFIVVSYNTRALLADCLTSIYRQTVGLEFETIVVDNASGDGSQALVRDQFPRVILVESTENLGFGRANNLGFSRSSAPFAMFLNSDAVLLEDTAAALVEFLDGHPEAGLAGPAVILTDGSIQPKTKGMLPTARTMFNQTLLLSVLFPRSRFFSGLYVESAWGNAYRIGWVCGVCMVVRRAAYEQAGGFDPAIFMYAEDVDLCRRLAVRGWETWRVETQRIRHLCGGSTKTDAQVLRNRVLQQRNFMRIIDVSMGPLGRLVTRISWVAGLAMRAAARGVLSALGGAGRRLAFQADLYCLADFIGLRKTLPGGCHAHRA